MASSSAAFNDGDWRALAAAMGLHLPGGGASCPRLAPLAASMPQEADKARKAGGNGTALTPSMPAPPASKKTASTSTSSQQQIPQTVAGLAAAKAAWASQKPTSARQQQQQKTSAPPPSRSQSQQQQVAAPALAPPPPAPPPQAPPQQQQQRRLASCPLCGVSLPADNQAASVHVQECAAAAMADDW
mgnify:CR=1 FL=1